MRTISLTPINEVLSSKDIRTIKESVNIKPHQCHWTAGRVGHILLHLGYDAYICQGQLCIFAEGQPAIGTEHSWNAVKINGVTYYLDFTAEVANGFDVKGREYQLQLECPPSIITDIYAKNGYAFHLITGDRIRGRFVWYDENLVKHSTKNVAEFWARFGF